MLKKIMLALALIVPMLASAQGTVKIGYVNADEVLFAMPETKQVQTQLAAISKKYEDDLGKMRLELQTKMEDFQKLGENEPPSIRERKAKDIEDLQKRIEDFYQQAQTELQRQQQTLIAPIHARLQDAIDAVGKEGGFTIIVQKEALLFYAAPAVDITPLVKTKLGIK